MSRFHLHTQIEIVASAASVWQVLTDFSAYPQWNPFIRSIVGRPEGGSRLSVTVQPLGRQQLQFSPTALVSEPERELQWRGRFLMPGIFDGEHRFLVEPLEGRVRFVQSEEYRGVLVGLLRSSLDRETRQGFEAMNEALKARVERLTQT